MSHAPAVSVIVPLYNKRETIARTINSILAQTFQSFELLIVDDQSTDGSKEIVRQFNDPRVQLMQQANAGPGTARNAGIRASCAEWVAFLDADDEWMPDYLQRAMRDLHRNRQCDVYCGGRFWDPGHVSREPFHRSLGIVPGPWRLDPATPAARMKLLIEFFFAGSTLARRDVLLHYGGFYEQHCTFGEDIYLWLQIALNHWIYRDPAPAAIWHREDSDLSAGRPRHYPVPPILTDPEPLRHSCPAEYRDALERYLSNYAWLTAERFAWQGDGKTCRQLLRQYAASLEQNTIRLQLLSWVSPLIAAARSVPFLRKTARKWRRRASALSHSKPKTAATARS